VTHGGFGEDGEWIAHAQERSQALAGPCELRAPFFFGPVLEFSVGYGIPVDQPIAWNTDNIAPMMAPQLLRPFHFSASANISRENVDLSVLAITTSFWPRIIPRVHAEGQFKGE
jgi:hypothetical protein